MAIGPSREPEGEGAESAMPVASATASLTSATDSSVQQGQRADRKKKQNKGGPLAFAKELPVLLLLAFLLALLIKTFLVQAFYIPSASMEPTLMIGDRVLVNKVVYHFHPPRRGDIIVFQDPHGVPVHRNPASALVHWVTEGLGVSQSPDKDFIKRVIGVPGDSIEVRNGVVYVNGQALGPEPYVSPIRDHSNWGPQKVPPGDLFVMGDNRTNSNDSRGTLGFIPIDKVVGRAFIIIWPPSRIHWLSTPSYSSG